MDIKHVAAYYPKGRKEYLFLIQKDHATFWWKDTSIEAGTLKEAISCASMLFACDYFSLINCGFRYNLPIRDETGTPALFWQMAMSYACSNGHYFDESVGHMCYVDFASLEALDLWRKIKKTKL